MTFRLERDAWMVYKSKPDGHPNLIKAGSTLQVYHIGWIFLSENLTQSEVKYEVYPREKNQGGTVIPHYRETITGPFSFTDQKTILKKDSVYSTLDKQPLLTGT